MPVDLYALETFENGHPFDMYRWLRDNDPVHRNDEPGGPGFWAVTRWSDIRFVNSHEEFFSHWPVSTIEDFMETDNKSMVNIDPPLHSIVRQAAIPGFLPGAVRARLPRFESAAQAVVDEVSGQPGCDLVVDIAGKIAAYVTADVLSISREDAVKLYEHIEVGLGGGAFTEEERQAAQEALVHYAVGVWEERRSHPGDDVCSMLAACEIDGEPMSLGDFCANLTLLIIGAGDTTRHLIAGGMLALFENPDQQKLLTDDIDRGIASAVEEMLRWVTPVIYNRRNVKSEVVLGGKTLLPGDKVCVYYGAGNRDPEVFPDADRFDIRRSPNHHLSFSGQGQHFCLGAHVARAEATAMIKAVFSAFPSIHLAGDVEWERSNFVMGPAHLPVSW